MAAFRRTFIPRQTISMISLGLIAVLITNSVALSAPLLCLINARDVHWIAPGICGAAVRQWQEKLENVAHWFVPPGWGNGLGCPAERHRKSSMWNLCWQHLLLQSALRWNPKFSYEFSTIFTLAQSGYSACSDLMALIFVLAAQSFRFDSTRFVIGNNWKVGWLYRQIFPIQCQKVFEGKS